MFQSPSGVQICYCKHHNQQTHCAAFQSPSGVQIGYLQICPKNTVSLVSITKRCTDWLSTLASTERITRRFNHQAVYRLVRQIGAERYRVWRVSITKRCTDWLFVQQSLTAAFAVFQSPSGVQIGYSLLVNHCSNSMFQSPSGVQIGYKAVKEYDAAKLRFQSPSGVQIG